MSKKETAKAQAKAAREREALIKDMRNLGIAESVILAAFAEAQNHTNPTKASLEAELCLFYVQTKGEGFRNQICPKCNQPFAYYYKMTKGPGLHCSDECRAAALKELGILWDPTKPPEERWLMVDQTEGEVLVTLPAPAFAVASALVQKSQEQD